MPQRVVVFVVALLACAGTAAQVSARPRPALRLVTLSPLRVHGSGFGARERVRVRLRSLGTLVATRRVRATRRGGFTVGFAGAGIDRCSGFSITAVGRSGRRATVRWRIAAKCPPA
jgi:hypothetical protein